MAELIWDDELLGRVGRVFELAGSLSTALQREPLDQGTRSGAPHWVRQVPAIEEFMQAVQSIPKAALGSSGALGGVAQYLQQAASVARQIQHKIQAAGTWQGFQELIPDLSTISNYGCEAIRKYMAHQEAVSANGEDAEAQPQEFTRLDRFEATADGHLKFLEWVHREVREQANALRDNKYPDESIEKQLRDGIAWLEAGRRVAALTCLPTDVVEEAARLFRWDLDLGTVELLADLLGPAVRALRAARMQIRERQHGGATSEKVPVPVAQRRAPVSQLTDYFAEVWAVEDRWCQEDFERLAASGRGRNCGSSPWNHHRELLAEIDRRHGVGPEDPRVYSIAAYRAEAQAIDEAWQEVCRQNNWLVYRERDKAELERYWLARHGHELRLDDLDARHFGRLVTDHIELTSRRLLWAHITKSAIRSLEIDLMFRGGPALRRNERGRIPFEVERVLSLLHQLQIPGAKEPPYADLSLPESIDLLRSIANDLERDEEVRQLNSNSTSRRTRSTKPRHRSSPAGRRVAANRRDSRALRAEGCLANLDDNVPLSSAAIAEKLDLDAEALRQRLIRYRRSHLECFVEVENPRPGEPKFLYRIGAVRHVLRDAIASGQRTGK